MTTPHLRSAASFTFQPSIPRRWEVNELLRRMRKLTKTTAKTVEQVVVSMMAENQEILKQNVYGLTSIALYKAGILGEAHTLVCALRIVGTDDKVEVLSNNHRFHRVGSDTVDPLGVFYSGQGKQVEHFRPFRIDGYSTATIKGLLEQFKDDNQLIRKQRKSDLQMWFMQSIHRICRRQGLAPDLYGTTNATSDSTSRRSIRDKRAFIGLMRAFLPRMRSKAQDEEKTQKWVLFFKEALIAEFPKLRDIEFTGIVEQILADAGPEAPSTFRPTRRKIQMVEPESSGQMNPNLR